MGLDFLFFLSLRQPSFFPPTRPANLWVCVCGWEKKLPHAQLEISRTLKKVFIVIPRVLSCKLQNRNFLKGNR